VVVEAMTGEMTDDQDQEEKKGEETGDLDPTGHR
jgi:hypothetical protein